MLIYIYDEEAQKEIEKLKRHIVDLQDIVVACTAMYADKMDDGLRKYIDNTIGKWNEELAKEITK